MTAGVWLEMGMMKRLQVDELHSLPDQTSGPDPGGSQWSPSILWSAQQGSKTEPWSLPSEQPSAAPVPILHLMAVPLPPPPDHLP